MNLKLGRLSLRFLRWWILAAPGVFFYFIATNTSLLKLEFLYTYLYKSEYLYKLTHTLFTFGYILILGKHLYTNANGLIYSKWLLRRGSVMIISLVVGIAHTTHRLLSALTTSKPEPTPQPEPVPEPPPPPTPPKAESMATIAILSHPTKPSLALSRDIGQRLDGFFHRIYHPSFHQECTKFLNEVTSAVVGAFPRNALTEQPHAIPLGIQQPLDLIGLYEKLLPSYARVARLLRPDPMVWQDFWKLHDLRIPLSLDTETRFQHMHVVASPGSGKSTLFSHFINHDLDAVARGEASVVVMESTRQLVTSLARLKRFAPGGDLEGKLLIIDAEDVEHPIALNLFNANTTDRTLSARDREAAYNATVSMLDYVFRSLLGAELTSRMSTLLNFTINLLLKVPGATIDTMIDIMQPNGIERYRDVLNQCDPDTQLFFRVRFNEPGEMQRTKSHVVERLFAIKRIPAIARLFSSTESKLNLFDEMNQGRVILINADKDVLQEEGVEIYSRFFLALILMAAQKRTLIPQHERLATFVYIDEAQDVIRRDEKLLILLDQARKFNVGMVLAHQHLSQGFLPPVLSALYSSTAIKFAARLSDSDANTLARNMACDAQNLVHTPPFSMMLFARGLTHNAVLYNIPNVSFDRMPKMSDEEYDAIRDDLRRRYTGSTTPPPAPPPTQDPTKASEW